MRRATEVGFRPCRTLPALTEPAGVRFSIVIPTFQRRDVVRRAVAAVLDADAPWPIEVVVVVDGSTDGTEAALAGFGPARLRVEVQPNLGRAAACNRGVEVAVGELVLLLDDDMIADPGLLVAHDRAHRDGADGVVGHIPVHPDSPPGLLRDAIGRWADARCERLAASGGELDLSDLLTGQFSIARATYATLGGFDSRFTGGGTFGGEDTDLLHRARSRGLQIVFAPDAISHQLYVVRPAQYLRQWHEAGRADAALLTKHPELAPSVRDAHHFDRRLNRLVWWRLARVPPLAWIVRAPLRRVAVALAGRPRAGRRATRFFFRVRDMEYWTGARAGAMPIS